MARIAQQRDPTAGWLFVDYPGYGRCAGNPTKTGVIRNAQQAMEVLAARFQLSAPILWSRTGLLGHSMGCAAVLHAAKGQPVRAVVLVAPFTTLKAMSARTVGWPLCEVLRDRWDNLHAFAALVGPPPLTVIHGEADRLIPMAMGEAVATAGAGRFVRIPEADHNGVLDDGEAAILEALQR
jgi:pimeloyl-ACP methyl ester carboxylesterase